MAQWLRRLPTEQEIPGSSPGVVVFVQLSIIFLPLQGNGVDISQVVIRERDMALNELRKLRAVCLLDSYLISFKIYLIILFDD